MSAAQAYATLIKEYRKDPASSKETAAEKDCTADD
jgi:hypothetical protein